MMVIYLEINLQVTLTNKLKRVFNATVDNIHTVTHAHRYKEDAINIDIAL